MDGTNDLETIHAHANAIHDEAVIINEMVIDPVHDMAGFLQAAHAGQHDGAGAIGGHVEEGFALTPRQHALLGVKTRVDIALQSAELFVRAQLLQLAGAGHSQGHPGLVIVVAVLRQRAQVSHVDATNGVRDECAAHLGVLAQCGVDLAVQVVGLPPVVPMDEERFLGGGRPAHHGKVGTRQAPHGVRVALIDGCLREVSAVCPFF